MEYIINKKYDKMMLKVFLQKELSLSSRLIRYLKKYETSILVNGVHANVTHILNEGDVLFLDFSDKEDDVNECLEKTEIPVEIVFENENYTVINKPAGMPTHQSLKHYTDTLANALAFRYRDKPYVFRAINRLDKDTSGIVLTANNRFYADILCEKLKNGKFHKQYVAIVKGRIDSKGEVNAPIARLQESIITRGVCENGDKSITLYEPILVCDDATVLLVTPITGRTHQIRVHMAYIGHAIIGDDLYGEPSEEISRQALHAYSLKIDGEGEFKAELPADMKQLIRRYFGNVEGI